MSGTELRENIWSLLGTTKPTPFVTIAPLVASQSAAADAAAAVDEGEQKRTNIKRMIAMLVVLAVLSDTKEQQTAYVKYINDQLINYCNPREEGVAAAQDSVDDLGDEAPYILSEIYFEESLSELVKDDITARLDRLGLMRKILQIQQIDTGIPIRGIKKAINDMMTLQYDDMTLQYDERYVTATVKMMKDGTTLYGKNTLTYKNTIYSANNGALDHISRMYHELKAAANEAADGEMDEKSGGRKRRTRKRKGPRKRKRKGTRKRKRKRERSRKRKGSIKRKRSKKKKI